MNREELIERITREVIRVLGEQEGAAGQSAGPSGASGSAGEPGEQPYAHPNTPEYNEEVLRWKSPDLTEHEYKDTIQFDAPSNPLALRAMERATTARVGIGRAGERLTTKALLSLRADHAMAKDAVLKEVDASLLEELNLPVVQSKAEEINEHLTRPDLGRQLSDEAVDYIKSNCIQNPQIEIYVSDGLSNSAVENNIPDLLPILMDGLKDAGIKVGTPIFVKYGRVGTGDAVCEAMNAEMVCVLLGERPGLAASDSMSAYITYGAYVGIPESKRTVVSNIHKNGIQPVEAGAYLVDLLQTILREKKSGVDLQL